MNNGYYPYSVGINLRNFSQELKPDGQLQKYKEEERFQKANSILPFEIDNINDVMSDIFVRLTDLRKMLSKASQNKEINKEVISSIHSKIDKINEIILDIPEDLDKIGL